MGGVSYTLTVKVEAGQASIVTSAAPPDGEFTIAGHDDSTTRQISVTRRGPDGRFIASATHTHGLET